MIFGVMRGMVIISYKIFVCMDILGVFMFWSVFPFDNCPKFVKIRFMGFLCLGDVV